MERTAVADMLEKLIGLDYASLGTAGLSHIVREMMKRYDITSEAEYLELLDTSPKHREELIDAATVPETWFFRDPKSFECLGKIAQKNFWSRSRGKMKILSLACCTGEEPYSAAMTLLDAGMNPDDFYITAIDINPVSIELARRGVYRKKAFRSLATAPDNFRQRFFRSRENGTFEIDPRIINSVKFAPGNLARTSTLPGGQYDVIFCRNVLIYLTAEVREKLIEYIYSVLADDGVLFVGPSEMVGHPKMKVIQELHSFAYGKYTPQPRKALPKPTPLKIPRPLPKTKVRPRKTLIKKTADVAEPQPKKKQEEKIQPAEALRQAQMLADKGDITQARDICVKLIAFPSDYTSGAYYLLGVMSEAENDFDLAKEFFKKAVYLRPDHVEALENLMLLARQEGDLVTELRLLERIKRLKSRNESGAK